MRNVPVVVIFTSKGCEMLLRGPDVRAAMKEFFQSLLPADHPEIDLDRAHRVGPRQDGDAHGPRDILVKL